MWSHTVFYSNFSAKDNCLCLLEGEIWTSLMRDNVSWDLIKVVLCRTESWALSPWQDSVFLLPLFHSLLFDSFWWLLSESSSEEKNRVLVPVSGTLGGSGPEVSSLKHWLEWPQAALAPAPPLGRPWQLGDPVTLYKPYFCHLLCCCLNKTSHQQCLLQDLGQESPNRTIDTRSDNLVSSNQSS